MYKYGLIPRQDSDLVEALKAAGITYEERVRLAKFQKNKTEATTAPAKKPEGKEHRGAVSGGTQKQKTVPVKEGKGAAAVTDSTQPRLWEGPSWREGVPQEELDRYDAFPRSENKCKRCGNKGHKGPWCFATKSVEGTTLPPCPNHPKKKKVAATKRKREDNEEEPESPIKEEDPPEKRAKIAAVVNEAIGKQQAEYWDYVTDSGSN